MSAPTAVSRRGFLRGGLLGRALEAAREGLAAAPAPPARPAPPSAGAAASPAAPSPRGRMAPLLRPPGALDEATFLGRCDGCLDCARACPYGSLSAAPARLGVQAGTPHLTPHEAPCHLCPERPCAVACPTGALDAVAPARMGTAEVLEHLCLAGGRGFCSTCAEQCPTPGALRLDRSGRPVVDARACTGCGICAFVCPAPGKAMLIRPTPARAACRGEAA